jgi:hypothetical protein
MKKPFFIPLVALTVVALHLLINDYQINIFFKQLSASYLCGIILMTLISYFSLGEGLLEKIMITILIIVSVSPILSFLLDAEFIYLKFIAIVIGYAISMRLTYVMIKDFKSSYK